MSVDSANVRVFADGGVFIAPVGTDAPGTVDEALDGAWVECGYLSEDGAEVDLSTDSDTLAAWQRADVVRTITKKAELKLKLPFIEVDREVVNELFFGSGATVAADGLSMTVESLGASDEVAMVLDLQDGGKSQRWHFPKVGITDRGSLNWKSDAYVVYEVEVTATKGSDPTPYVVKQFYSEPLV